MHRKRLARTVEGAAETALRQRSTRELAPDEERVTRMRLGASLSAQAPLDRIAIASDAEIEVLAYEIEAYLRLRGRRDWRPTERPPEISPGAKEKIVRALRKKP